MEIILRFIDICRFKATPADVPSSQFLLQISVFIYFILGILMGRISEDWTVSLATSLSDIFLMIIVTSLLLKTRGFQVRTQQTITAMAGAGSCITIVGMPIVAWFYYTTEQEQMNGIALLFMVMLMFWSLMVTAHIFRYALEIKSSTAAMLTVTYTVLSIVATGLAMSGVA